MYQTHHLYHFLAICNTAHLVPKKKNVTLMLNTSICNSRLKLFLVHNLRKS